VTDVFFGPSATSKSDETAIRSCGSSGAQCPMMTQGREGAREARSGSPCQDVLSDKTHLAYTLLSSFSFQNLSPRDDHLTNGMDRDDTLSHNILRAVLVFISSAQTHSLQQRAAGAPCCPYHPNSSRQQYQSDRWTNTQIG